MGDEVEGRDTGRPKEETQEEKHVLGKIVISAGDIYYLLGLS